MRFVVPGLLLVVALGCGGFDQVLEQSFEQSFVETCVEEHAPNVEGLTDATAACTCAKAAIEAEFTEPFDRLAAIADPAKMSDVLTQCYGEAGGAEAEAQPEAVPAGEPEDVEAPEPPAE